jgi:hypothetical protein
MLQFNDYVRIVVDELAPVTISTPEFVAISHQFPFTSPENNEFGYAPGPGTASAFSYVAIVKLPKGHHVAHLLVRNIGHEEFQITKTIDVV